MPLSRGKCGAAASCRNGGSAGLLTSPLQDLLLGPLRFFTTRGLQYAFRVEVVITCPCDVFVICALVIYDARRLDIHDAGCKLLDEPAVVRDEDERAGVGL